MKAHGVVWEMVMYTVLLTCILGNLSVLFACESFGSALQCSQSSESLSKWSKEHRMDEIETLFLSNVNLSSLEPSDFVGFSSLSKLIINNCLLTNEDVLTLFEQFVSLTKIRIESTNVSDNVNIIISNNKMLTKIELMNNHVTTICGMILNNFVDLFEINFSRNKITHILTSWDVNRDTSQINKLCTGFTDVKYGPLGNSFSNLNSLMRIFLQNNFIERVRKFTFGVLPKLVLLDLSHNQIRDMEPFAFSLSRHPGAVSSNEGAVVNVSFNQLSQVRNGTFQHSDVVTVLDLSHNRIRSLSSGFLSGLPSLLYLNMSGNTLRTLEEGLFRPTQSLRGLDLHDNRIGEIRDGAFADLQDLATLRLSRNRLSTLNHDSFRGLRSLQVLLLQANELRALGGAFSLPLTHLPLLRRLDLSSNSLEALERAAFAGCSALELLEMANNDVTRIEDFAFDGSEALQSLDLSGNNITCLSCFSLFGLSSLEQLHLGGNRLRKLQFVQLASLSSLRSLFLRLPLGSQCECAAFKWLQKQRVDVRLEPGAKDERCTALYEKFMEAEYELASAAEGVSCEQERDASSCGCHGDDEGGNFVEDSRGSSTASTAAVRKPESSSPTDATLSFTSVVTLVADNPTKSQSFERQTASLTETTVMVSQAITFTASLGQTSLFTSTASILQTVKYSASTSFVSKSEIEVVTGKELILSTKQPRLVETREFKVVFYVVSIFLLLLCTAVIITFIFKLVYRFRWRNHIYDEIEMGNV